MHGVGLYCWIRTRAVGGRGITGHAIATTAVSALLLLIWIPNFLSARERAPADQNTNRVVLAVHVSHSGTIQINGTAVTLEALEKELDRVSAAGGVMRYSRDDPSGQPHPNAMAVIQAAADRKMPIEMLVPAGN